MRLAHQKRAIQRKDDRTSSSLLRFSYRRVPAEYYLKKRKKEKRRSTMMRLAHQKRAIQRKDDRTSSSLLRFSFRRVPAEYYLKKKKERKKKDAHSFKGTRQATWSTAAPLRAVQPRFLSKRLAFVPEKMCLELAAALQEVGERWSFYESGGNCAQETFRGHLDSERVKLTVICTASIATLPRTSFPDDNFASCLFTWEHYHQNWNTHAQCGVVDQHRS